MATVFIPVPPADIARRPLTEEDAVNIWIARWLRIRPKELIRRYRCDPRRLYEIWEESHFPGSRAKAMAIFATRYPGLHDRIDPGAHRRVPKAAHPDQMSLFDVLRHGL